MAKTPEGKVKKAVEQVLAKHPNIWRYMPVPGGYGKSALDYILCVKGVFVTIETKAPGEWLTPLQRHCAWEILEASGKVFIISGEEGLRSLERWLSNQES